MTTERCQWGNKHELMSNYHDTEWGKPTRDDLVHYEFLVLESAQAGLSWDTVLRKREAYRKAFSNFDPEKVAKYTEKHVEKMLQNEGLIRNRAKIEAAINNAKQFLKIQEEFGSFSNYIWQFVGNSPTQNKWTELGQLPIYTPEAEAFSKDMKKRGFKFLGPTVCYSHMQATGLVNDHLVTCFRHKEVQR